MFDRTFSGVLGPHFAQLKQIGGGGSGSVYSGVDTRFDFPVCIKRVAVSNKVDCRTALREIRIRRRLRHENIVGLLNAITADGTDVSEISPANFRDTSCIYIVQELLDADLRQVIEGNNRLGDDYVKLFFYQLLRGLKYIHSANVLHRDLKPSNIMVNVSSLELRIGDFGHSVVLDPEYNHSNCLSPCAASLWYKAPELIVGSSQYSTASDMWSVGCILAEMLLGRPLFEGENDLEQLELIIHTIEINDRDQVNVRQCLTEEVKKMYTGKPKFPLQSKFQKVDVHALHLLERLLSFNAADRVTAELALRHPYLQEYSCAADEPVCLKQLHLEHEVDDFLEYTLKDLIVGECVALAEEQPRIHMQMSSYSSLMDIVKELNNGHNETSPHSVEDGKNTPKITCENDGGMANENGEDNSRFKVLEVLKEEHTSSSDSNGITAHDEGVSEEPLVSDHAMFSSGKWETQRHHVGHRRHHSHHRRKSCGERRSSEDSMRSRKRKISPGNKVHLGQHSEHEFHWDTPVEDQVPGGYIPGRLSPENHYSGGHSPDHSSSSDSGGSYDRCALRLSDPTVGSDLVSSEAAEDDKVRELISKSCQLIADKGFDHDFVGDSKQGDSGHVSEDLLEDNKAHNNDVFDPRSASVLPCLTMNKHCPKGSQPQEDGLACLADASVDDVIRRSRELIGEVNQTKGDSEGNGLLNRGFNGSVEDLISKSEHVLAASRRREISEESLEEQKVVGQGAHAEERPLGDLRPESVTDNILQPMLSDPYHLRESNRRMLELLEESHTLLSNIRTDHVAGEDHGTASSQAREKDCSKSSEGLPVSSNTFAGTEMEFEKRDLSPNGLVDNYQIESRSVETKTSPIPSVLVNGVEHDDTSRTNTNPGRAETGDGEIDLVEMSAVLDQARRLLNESGQVAQTVCDPVVEGNHPGPCVVADTVKNESIPDCGSSQEQAAGETKHSNKGIMEENSREPETKYVEIAQITKHVDCGYVCLPAAGVASEQATAYDVATVASTAAVEDQILVMNSAACSPLKYFQNQADPIKETNDVYEVEECYSSTEPADITMKRNIPGDSLDNIQGQSVTETVTCEGFVVDDYTGVVEDSTEGDDVELSVAVSEVKVIGSIRSDSRACAEQLICEQKETEKLGDDRKQNGTIVVSVSYSPQNGYIQSNPNDLTCEEITIQQSKDSFDPVNALKQAPNSRNYSVNVENGQDEKNREDTDFESYYNGLKPSSGYDLKLSSEAPAMKESMGYEDKPNFDTGKNQSVQNVLVGTYRNGNISHDVLVERLNSGDLVEKLFRNNVCVERSVNSKDDVGLKNFYATLKIKSLMRNHSRTFRDKRVDSIHFRK